MSVFLVVFLFAVWSSIFSIGKAALEYAPPVFVTGFRMVLGALAIFIFLMIKEKKFPKLRRKEWVSIAVLGLFSIYLTNVLEFWGLQHLSAAKTCFIYSLSPFFTALLSYIHFKEKMNIRKAIGLFIGFAGMIPVFASQEGNEELFKLNAYFSLPTLAVIGAAFFSVYGWVLLRMVVKTESVSPFVANSFSMFFGGILAIITSFFTDSWAPLPVQEGSFLPFFKLIVLMTLISNIFCYNLYGHLLKKYTATFLSFMGLLSPFFASFHGYIFLGEPISIPIFISTGIVCAGLWLVYSAELKQGYLVKSKKNTYIGP